MSTGFVLNIDDKLLKNLEKADELVQDIGKHSEQTRDMFNNAFQSMATGSLDGFISKLMSARQAIQDIGDAKVSDKGLGSISTQAVQGADSVTTLIEAITRLIQVTQNTGNNLGVISNISEQANNSKEALTDMQAELEKVFKIENKNVSNSAIAKLDEEIDKAMKRLMQLQQQLDYYPKGEGSNMLYPAGNVDPTAIDAEVSSLIEEIELLEQLRDMERARAKENLALASQIDAVNNQRLEQKRKERESERASATEKSQRAKEINRQYEEADKEQRHRTIKRWSEEEKASMKAAQTVLAELLRVEEQKEKAHQAELKRIEREERDRIKSATELFDKRGAYSSLQDLQNYARELKRTMATLDPKSKEWKELNIIYKQTNREIKSINNSMKDLNDTHKSLINTADQLKRAFALVFSVSAIKGYVTQIARVRGEFELQQRSLQAILQNKDEADKLWQQTIQLAVRSPFQVKELVTYTKQLAAYRVESDKLYDTTKMLADVSAGLGVDMNRLILAYGQVKAANYLRGTELRQFSEAGVNILEELAKYFTELEGRAVSVGDVFERVSKRMVTFADVEGIFKRITSEGGVFYNMQEVQAETLKGQISNLRDAIDIMLNEIGKDNEGVLKGTVSTLRELVSSWREVEFYLSKVIVAYATYKGVVGIASLANSSLANGLLNIITKSDTATKVFDKLSNGIENVLSKLFKFPAAISGIKTLLGGLATLGVPAAIAAIVVGLMELWRRATKTTRELKALNKELEQIYSQDTTALNKQIKGFTNLVSRLKNVNKGTREHKELIGALNQNYGEYLGFIVDETTSYQRLESSINSVNLALTNKAKLNTYEKAYGKVLEKNNEIISERQETVKKQLEKVNVFKAGNIIQLNETEINDIFALFEKKVANAGRAGYDLAKEAFREYGVGIEYGDIFNWGVFIEYSEAVLRNKEEEIKLQNRVNSLYGGATASTIEMRQELDRINEEEKKELANAETRRQKEEVLLKYAKQRIDAEVKYEGLAADVAAKRYTELEKKSKTVIDVNEKIAKSVNKLGAKYAKLIYIDDEQSAQGIDSIAKSAAESYELQKAIIDSQNKLKAAGTVYDKEALDNAGKSAEAYKYLLTLLGRIDLINKSTNKTEDEATKRLKAQISLIKEMNKEYEKLRKEYDEIEAIDKIRKYFTGTATSLGLDISESLFDDEGTKASLEKLLSQVPEKLQPLVQKALDNVEVDIHFTAKDEQNKELKQQVEDLFSRYDITLDLEKLGLSKDLMESLFDVDYLDLDSLKSKVRELKPQFDGTEMEDQYAQYVERINKLSKKEQEQQARDFVKFLTKKLDETTVLMQKSGGYLSYAKKLLDEGKITAEQYSEVVNEVIKETNEGISKVNLNLFKDSDTYIKAMGSLAGYTADELKMLRESLQAVIADNSKAFSADEITAYYDAIARIAEQEQKLRTPWEKTGFAEIGYLNEQYKERERLISEESRLEQNKQTLIQQRINLEQELADATETGEDTDWITEQLNSVTEGLGIVDSKIKKNAAALALVNGNIEKISNGLGVAWTKVAIGIAQVNNIAQGIKDSFNEIKDVAASFGVDTENESWTKAGIVIESFANATENATGMLTSFVNGDIGGTLKGLVGFVGSIIKGFNQFHDAKYDAIIKIEQKNVEKLAKAYDRLEKHIADAMDVTQLQRSSNAARENLEKQIESTQKMINAEKDKKDTDEEAVEEYKTNLDELNEKLKELEAERVKSLGGFGDVDAMKSATEEFVDAWMEAYKETGDGLDALEGKFNEFLENTIKKQIVMRGANNILKGLYENYDAMFSEDSAGGAMLTPDEADDIRKLWEQSKQQLNDYLLNISKSLGVTTGEADGELSGLQAGIQGISESQAEIISAYLNSLRFFVADNNSVMKQLRDYVVGTDDTANPMLAQLRIIAQQTSAMRTLLESVVQSGHSRGQSGIRVFID